MASVRIAGIVGEKDALNVKNIASLMQVARWVHLISQEPLDAATPPATRPALG